MNLSEFMNKTTAQKENNEWEVSIPLFDGTKGKLYVKDAATEFEAKENAFIFLSSYFDRNNNNTCL